MSNIFHRRCPACGAKDTMVKASQQRTKFSVSKAIVGACIAGPVGLAIGGCIGNRKISYKCTECGFVQEPDTLI